MLFRSAELMHPVTGQWFEDWIYPDEHGVSVYYRDISERKKNEKILLDAKKELQTANERFELIAQAVNESLWDWDMVTNEVWGNDLYYEMIGGKNSEVDNFNNYLGRFDKKDLSITMAAFELALEKKETYFSSEYRFLHANDQWIEVLSRQVIVYDKTTKKPIRCLGSIMDITDLKIAQRRLLHEKEVSDSLINSLPGVF